MIRNLEVGTEKPFKEYQNRVFDAPTDIGSQQSSTPEMIQQAREILKIDYDKASQKATPWVWYPVSAWWFDFYCNWISIRDIRYQDRKSGKSPVLPIVQILHKRKVQLHHELAWMVIVNLIPEISSCKFVATSDDECTPLLEKLS